MPSQTSAGVSFHIAGPLCCQIPVRKKDSSSHWGSEDTFEEKDPIGDLTKSSHVC